MSEDTKPIVVENFRTEDIPRIFAADKVDTLDFRDLISYIRGHIERNPWVPVILDSTENAFAVVDLEEYRIYWKGLNDNKAYDIQSIGKANYCIVPAEELNGDDEDCGLSAWCDDYRDKYRIIPSSLLIVGQNDNGPIRDLLFKLQNYIAEERTYMAVFPTFIRKANRLMENGLDISNYADMLSKALERNELDASLLKSVLAELDSKITPFRTVIQDLQDYRTPCVRMLTVYLTLKYNLPPLYVSAFLMDYVSMEFGYPRTSLSLYERVSYLYRLPRVVGYIGRNYGFNCLAMVGKKILPLPHYVFNLRTMELEPDVDGFALDTPGMHFADYRSTFPESKTMFVNTSKQGMSSTVNSDVVSNEKWLQIFNKLSYLVKDEPAFLSVKNTILVEKNGERYILYCPEECGLELTFLSEYFGQLQEIITEKDFHRIIDAQIEFAILQKARADSKDAGNKALALRWSELDVSKALKPAVPYDVVLFMKMLPFFRNGLSYYDNLLRCCKDVLPIVSSLDSDLADVSPIFSEIGFQQLLKDPQAKSVITCFGTLYAGNKSPDVLPITFRAFSDGSLM